MRKISNEPYCGFVRLCVLSRPALGFPDFPITELSVLIPNRLCFSDLVRWRRWRAIAEIIAALCLCPSARDPPPIGVLLKIKVKPNSTERWPSGRSPFRSIYPVESVSFCQSFHPCNPLPTHWSAVGRNVPGLLWLNAEC